MKKQIIMVAAISIALPLLAQETNEVGTPKPDVVPEKAAQPENKDRRGPTPEQKKQFRERHLKLMEKALKEIGVTEEQQHQILALQEVHREKMKANWKRINKARRELSRLQDSGAGEEELEAAIQEVSDAQSEQLRTLVKNRMEMERILGKEKNDLLMKKAREFFREHGKRAGGGMPPRPDMPPMPNSGQESESPPPPPVDQSDEAETPPTP